ncbi:MAG TPA: RNA polymerase sigma factor [Bryobacteraceae bacterium]|jgi:RNA polymerase sigma-70 factor (ECF subfamily)|nr:RNA polymerase sigma factor [Bryobacteraceae bacterium]
MTNESVPNERNLHEGVVTDQFLNDPNEDSFTALFQVFAPQLVCFFRARSRELTLAEDLAQEVMLTVYRKAGQIRDRTLFRAWLFKIAHNALCRHYGRLTREVETVNLAEVDNRLAVARYKPAGTPAFEFRDWMAFLDPHERDVMTLRFVEQWEYHEIAAARATPIGTVQWRVFNSKKKLAGHLTSRQRQCAGLDENSIRKEKHNVTPSFIGCEQSRKAS